MKLWNNNRLDAEWEMPIEEIAQLYMQSEWPGVLMPLERKLRLFMTSQDGPISSVWDDEAEFERLLDQVIELERQHDLKQTPTEAPADPRGPAR